MIRYVALDDDPMQLKLLLGKLDAVPQTALAASFGVPEEALLYLQNNQVDVAFLDIEMPGLSGMELAKKIVSPPLFVFITSHQKFALSSYELDAVDYILKPITLERLLLCFKKIHKQLDLVKQSSSEIKSADVQEEAFFIKEHNRFIKIEFQEVLYVESQNNFVQIFLANGKKHLVLVNMKNFEEQVPKSHFIRISRTHLVSKKKITAFSSDTIYLNQLGLAVGSTFTEHIHEMTRELKIISRFKSE